MTAAPSIQYAQTADGVSIAYTVGGEGPVLVTLASPLGHIQVDQAIPEAKSWYEWLDKGRMLVRSDGRGMGMSPGEVEVRA